MRQPKFAVLAAVIAITLAGPAAEAQVGPDQIVTLDQLEQWALDRNPTIGQARAAVSAAAGRAKQAGLYPNPVLSAVGEEIAAGPIIRGGELGGGFQQRFVTAGKLGLSRKVAEQEVAITEQAARAQRQRVLNAVRSLYYQALGDQYRVDVRTRLNTLAAEAVRISAELGNVGQADRPDVLAADVESQRIRLELTDATYRQERTWRQLAAIVNDSSLRPVRLAGDIENVPRLELEQALAAIYAESPELSAANINITRAEVALTRARKEKIPDIVVGGGVRYNRELLEVTAGGTVRRPVGPEGFFDVSVQIPIFNRNQGNVAAARAEVESAKLEVDRTRLALRSRLAEAYREYTTALTRVDQYKQEMLPKAQRAYELYLNTFRQMASAYPQVLISQRNLFQLQDEYVDALVAAWQHSVEIQGLLVGSDLELSGANVTMMPAMQGGEDSTMQ
jgi:cobalt-zinc-cadmium efflux system outer membrane protein